MPLDMMPEVALRSRAEQIVARAYEIIVDPACWTQHAEARDLQGDSCDPTSKIAVQFCAVGALMRAAFELGPQSYIASYHEALRLLVTSGHGIVLQDINDDVGHAAVMRRFKKALA